MSEAPLLEAADVHKSYALGPRTLEILRGVSLAVRRGEKLAIVGQSGAGKSTLLNVLGGLDRPTAGCVQFDGRDLYGLSGWQRTRVRATRIGFVFQAFHLLPELNLLENVMLPAWTRWDAFRSAAKHRKRATELIERVGLRERMEHRPDELSGGEQQRVALARALMNDPELVLADEPTGNLDSVTGEQVLDALFELVGDAHRTVVLVTHNAAIAARCDRLLTLRDGALGGPAADPITGLLLPFSTHAAPPPARGGVEPPAPLSPPPAASMPAPRAASMPAPAQPPARPVPPPASKPVAQTMPGPGEKRRIMFSGLQGLIPTVPPPEDPPPRT